MREFALDHSIIKDVGGFQRKALERVLSPWGGVAPYIHAGTLSLDVGPGPEIAALGRYTPDPFIVSERTIQYDESKKNDLHLAQFQQEHLHMRVMRDSVISVLETLQQEHQTLSLITNLYIFPEDGASYNHMRHVFELSAQLLVPGGLFIASLQWEDENSSYGVNFFRAGVRVLRDIYKYEFDMPLIEGGSQAGGLFVVARRPFD